MKDGVFLLYTVVNLSFKEIVHRKIVDEFISSSDLEKCSIRRLLDALIMGMIKI